MSTGPTSVNLMQRWKGASDNVVQAIKNASARTGVSFDYLMNKAQQESSFNPTAKASSSSATGLFQFIDSTWLQAVKDHGKEFGLGNLAAKISDDGKVADDATRKQILDLRNNPDVAANITAATTQDNADFLQNSLGGKVGQNELYMAHFLGLGGANKFLSARQDNGSQAAADLFPAAAAANKNVFFDASGRKRSLDQVYNFFAQKMDPASSSEPVTLVASSGKARSPVMTKDAAQGGYVGGYITPPVATNAFEDVQTAMTNGDRHLLETLLVGANNGKMESKMMPSNGQLLSPYTAMILARLNTPGEGGFAAAVSDSKNDNRQDEKQDRAASQFPALS